MTSCSNCGVGTATGARFCKSCGTPVRAQAALVAALACSGCGAELIAGAKFCRKCGTPPTGAEAAHAEAASLPVATPAPETVAAAEVVLEPAQVEAISVRDITPEVTPPVAQPAETTVAQEAEPEHVSLPITPEPARGEEPARPASWSTLEQGTSASTSQNATEPAPRQPSKALIAAGIATAIAVGGGGLFWWYSGKQPSTPVDQATQVQASQPTLPAEATMATQLNEPAQPIQPPEPPAQPEPGTPVVSALPTAPAPATQPPPIAAAAPALPAPAAPVKPARPVVPPDPMEAKIDELLRKAKVHVAKGQFDKAIATAESVLAIDAGNRAARSLISNAKSRQMEALRANTSLE